MHLHLHLHLNLDLDLDAGPRYMDLDLNILLCTDYFVRLDDLNSIFYLWCIDSRMYYI